MSDAWVTDPRPLDPEIAKAADRSTRPTEWATFAEKMQGATPAQLYAIFGGYPVEP